MAKTIAKATAASAAAIAMTNIAKTCPFMSSGSTKLENATKFTLAALSKSSIDIKTLITFLEAVSP